MMQYEFENLIGLKVTPQEYSEIESSYMACDDDKQTFCKRWVKEGGLEKLHEARLLHIENLKTKVKELNQTNEILRKENANLKDQLDASLDWKPSTGTGTNYSQDDYLELERCCKQYACHHPFDTSDGTRKRIAEEFGFDAEKIVLVQNVSTYEVNRYRRLRVKDTFIRSPQWVSTDYNYVRFDVMCAGGYMQWEMINGELLEYSS